MLVTDVFLELFPCPPVLDVVATGRAPSFDALLSFRSVEVVHDVPEPEHAPGFEHVADTRERYRFPEVGQVMEREARVHEVGPFTHMLVGEETGVDELDVRSVARGDLLLEVVQHHRRHVDRGHPRADGCR